MKTVADKIYDIARKDFEIEYFAEFLDSLPPVQETIEAKLKFRECLMWTEKAMEKA